MALITTTAITSTTARAQIAASDTSSPPYSLPAMSPIRCIMPNHYHTPGR